MQLGGLVVCKLLAARAAAPERLKDSLMPLRPRIADAGKTPAVITATRLQTLGGRVQPATLLPSFHRRVADYALDPELLEMVLHTASV